MPRTTRRRPLATAVTLAALVALIGACAESTAPIIPAPLPELESQVWHVHISDGQPLPALVGHRLADGALEQDFIDSSRFEISAAGIWEHKAWLRRLRNGAVVQHFTSMSSGSWRATPSAYEFRSNAGELLYSIEGPFGPELRMNLRYPGQDGVAVSILRRTPPPS